MEMDAQGVHFVVGGQLGNRTLTMFQIQLASNECSAQQS